MFDKYVNIEFTFLHSWKYWLNLNSMKKEGIRKQIMCVCQMVIKTMKITKSGKSKRVVVKK